MCIRKTTTMTSNRRSEGAGLIVIGTESSMRAYPVREGKHKSMHVVQIARQSTDEHRAACTISLFVATKRKERGWKSFVRAQNAANA